MENQNEMNQNGKAKKHYIKFVTMLLLSFWPCILQCILTLMI